MWPRIWTFWETESILWSTAAKNAWLLHLQQQIRGLFSRRDQLSAPYHLFPILSSRSVHWLIWVRTPFFYPGALLWAWSHWEYWGPGDLVIAMEQGFIPTEVGKVSRPTSANRSDLNREHSTVPVLPPQPELRNVPKDMHIYVRKWESVRPQTCDGQHKVDFFSFLLFLCVCGGVTRKGKQTWENWELSMIEAHDVKFPPKKGQ